MRDLTTRLRAVSGAGAGSGGVGASGTQQILHGRKPLGRYYRRLMDPTVLLGGVFRAAASRVTFAFWGIGHTLEATICSTNHLAFTILDAKDGEHLDVALRLWNKGGPDVSVISWTMNAQATYRAASYPKGPITLVKAGVPETLRWRLYPKGQLEYALGDAFDVTINLSNGVPKRFSTKVTKA